ncbi:MAG TPA: hypothetical protein G4O18_10475 [Dehalococcoidia bacterium]|nr:hypothetical protein [Dehalococcoidia bacterium]
MVTLDSAVEIGLNGFLNRYGDTRAKQELLLFWGLHPDARFSRLAVLSAMECSRLDVEKALKSMANDNLIDMRSDSGLITYSLTTNENIRQMVALLSTLDWGQRHMLLTNTHQVTDTCNLVSAQEGL